MSKIDVHHHIYPPVMAEALERHGGDPSGWYVPQWTVGLDNDLTAAIGVTTSILSVTAPGAVIETDSGKAAQLARQCNEYTASIRDAHPSKFGFLASLPSLFDTKACLEEIQFSLDVLKADGVTLFTRYGEGHDYLGAQAFRPIWEELSRRKAVVFIHPTHPVDTTLVNAALPQPMFDYPHETGRAAMDLLLSGTLHDYPGCKIILSHAGGTLPYLIYRAAVMLPHTPVSVGRSTAELIEEAREAFYYDTAISSNEITLKALFAFAKPGRVLFGSDFPNAPREGIVTVTKMLEDYSSKIAEEAWKDVQYRSALELFPRLKSVVACRTV